MSEWKEIKLGDYEIYIRRGVSPKYSNGSGVLVINQKCIRNGNIDLSLSKFHDPSKKISIEKKLQPGDILINSTGVGTAGRVAIFNFNSTMIVDSHVSIVRLNNKKIYPEFIFYNLRGREKELEDTAEGSTGQIELGGDGIRFLELKLPPLPEQKAIAEVLSSLDDKIDLLHRQNKTLEQMAETLFRQWFVEEAQKDWKEVTVSQFVNLNSKNITKEYALVDIEYLDTGALTEGDFGDLQAYRLTDAPSRAKRLVQHNDVLISTVRPNQKHYGIVKEPIENLVVSTGFCVITCSDIDPHFIYLLLTNAETTEYLHSIAEASTSTYPSLKPTDIGATTFKLPPKSLLDEFSEIAHNIWEKIQKNYNQINTLENQRDTLLPKLMSGEVRIAYNE